MSTLKPQKESPYILPPIKRQLSNTRRPRPPTIEEVSTADRTPLRSPKASKDKNGFRSIFRSKPTKENPFILEAPPSLSPSSVETSSNAPINSPTLSDSFQSRTVSGLPYVGIVAKGKPIGSKSKKQKRGSSASKPSKSPLPSHNTCDPLPLFRVYPHSIKSAKLVSSTLAADTIIRISNHNRSNSLRKDISQGILQDEQTEGTKAMAQKSGKGRSKHGRQLSKLVEWTHKIYVLVTSGYLLQYAGEGSFDRLPEKMLQLCKESVVFASDAIAGKHWVLQVSQSIDADGMPTADSRSLLSRLSFRGADYRRTTTSFLLILENAEEMEAWISAIRGEIESLGGKKHMSETGKPDDEQLKCFTSSSPVPTDSTTETVGTAEEQFKDGLTNTAPRPLSSIRPSIDSPSVASTTSREEIVLDSLKDNSHYRLSHLSSDPTTIGTSRGSTPSCSPSRDTFLPIEGYTIKPPRPNEMAIVDRRRSVQTVEKPVIGWDSLISSRSPQPRYSRPQSSMGYSGQNLANFSPSHGISTLGSMESSRYPNSPRFLCGNIVETPPKPNISSIRKRAPAALSLAPRITPVENSHSPSRSLHSYTHSSYTSRHVAHPRVDLSRPHTASAAITVLPRSGSFSNRSSELAAVEVYDFEQFEPLKSPPTRPPPLPPQNIPLSARTPTRVLDPIPDLQAPPSLSQISTPTSQYIRRPMSMQVRTNPPPPVSLHTHATAFPPVYSETANRYSPPRGMAPSLQPPFSQTQLSAKKVEKRRSLPQLVNGPPLVPPPKRALPPLPSGAHV